MVQENWFYLSFERDSVFRGGVYLKAWHDVDALNRASALKLNPGGTVQILGPLSEEGIEATVPRGLRYRLLSQEELDQIQI